MKYEQKNKIKKSNYRGWEIKVYPSNRYFAKPHNKTFLSGLTGKSKSQIGALKEAKESIDYQLTPNTRLSSYNLFKK